MPYQHELFNALSRAPIKSKLYEFQLELEVNYEAKPLEF